MIDISLKELEEIGKKLSKEFELDIELEDFDIDGVYKLVVYVNNIYLDNLNPLGHYFERVFEINTKFFINVRFYDYDLSLIRINLILDKTLSEIEGYLDDDTYKKIIDNHKEYFKERRKIQNELFKKI